MFRSNTLFITFTVSVAILMAGCGSLSTGEPEDLRPLRAVDEQSTLAKLGTPEPYGRNLSDADRDDQIPARAFLSFEAHEGEINSIVVSKRGRTAFTGGADGTIVRHTYVQQRSRSERSSFKIWKKTILSGGKPVLGLSLSPSEQYLAIAQVSKVVIFDLDAQKIVREMTQVRGRISSLAWDPREELLAFGSVDGAVHVWNLAYGKFAGQDNKNSLEHYPAGYSPIVRLLFHPSGRAIFTAEQDGFVHLWRLLRTEREIGLRDEAAVLDQESQVRRQTNILTLPNRIEDLTMSGNGGSIFVAVDDGQVYSAKTRGGRSGGVVPASTDSVFSVVSFEMILKNRVRKPLLATSDRAQRLRVLCELPKTYATKSNDLRNLNVSGLNPTKSNLPSKLDPQPVVKPRIQRNEDSDQSLFSGPVLGAVVAESFRFKTPLSMVRTGLQSPLLWGVQKTGNVVLFDARKLRKKSIWIERANRCPVLASDEEAVSKVTAEEIDADGTVAINDAVVTENTGVSALL